MASLPNTRTVTYEEWLRMPKVSGLTEEVVNGEIRMENGPFRSHAVLADGILTPKHFPGIEVRISEIWSD